MKIIALVMLGMLALSCTITKEASSARDQSVPVVVYGDQVVPVPDAVSLKDFLVHVPGVEVTYNDVFIRGSRNPLFVLDGILLNGGFSQAVAAVNVHEIGRVEVIRNLEGTAEYGSRARNGVIIITTKVSIEDPLQDRNL